MPEIILKNVTKRWGDFFGVKDLTMTIEDRAFITLLALPAAEKQLPCA